MSTFAKSSFKSVTQSYRGPKVSEGFGLMQDLMETSDAEGLVDQEVLKITSTQPVFLMLLIAS
jgi:hypothetical protein